MRLIALLLAAVLLAALPASAKERRHHHRSGKVVQVKRSHARKHGTWGFARRRRPARPVTAPPEPTAPGVAPKPVATATPPPADPTVPAANPRSVSVRSKEWSFTLSQPTVLAGNVRIQFDNSRAEDPHQLAVLGDRPGDLWKTDVQDPGVVSARTYSLQPGTYTLFCPLPDHEDRGMKATLTVR